MADILGIGGSGLSAYRQSLETIGNNITNANTEGYVRRQTTLQGVGTANETITSKNTGSGSGVAVEFVTRSTDDFVQAEARQATSAASQASALSDRLNNLQTALFSTNSDLGTAVQKFYSTVQDFATQPTSIPVRTTMLQSADMLASRFNSQAATLSQEGQSTLSDLKGTLDQANTLTSQLDGINKKINSLRGNAGATNDLLDQRDRVVNQIVNLMGVSIQTLPSGAVNLFMGSGTGGPEVVGPDGAKTLSASRENGDTGPIHIVMDPYGLAVPIPTISGGSAGGILAFDDQVTACTNQLNSLATGLSTALNEQHMKGVDLNGNPGQPLFSTNNLNITVPNTNRGTASATLGVTDPSKIGSGNYTAVYIANSSNWVVTNTVTKEQVVGQNAVSIDGMHLSFAGKPVDGDGFQFSPLTNAAAGMHVLIQDPNQLAGALPQLAQSGSANSGSGAITLANAVTPVPGPAIPKLNDIFTQSQSPSAALGIQNNGVVASIPSGSTNVTLSSLSTISAATFHLDPNALMTKAPASLTLTINGSPQSIALFSQGVPSAAQSKNDPMTQVVDEINRSLDKAQLSKQLFASEDNGIISINALGSNVVQAATIQNDNKTFSASGQIEVPAPASDIEILTAEGQQLAGKTLAGSDLSKLMTTANGFSSQAYYSQVPSTTPYRGVVIATSTSAIHQVTTTTGSTQSSTVSINATPKTDSPYVSGTSSAHAGAVYSLSVAGLSAIRLAGSAIVGQGSQAIAAAFASKISAEKPQTVITGQPFTLSPSDGVSNTSFSLAINGTTYPVSFQRATLPDGTLLPTGTFKVQGNPDIKISLTDLMPATTDPQLTASVSLSVSIPQSSTTAAPTISFSGAGTTALGIDGSVNQNLIATQPRQVDADGNPVDQTLSLLAGSPPAPLELTIQGTSGSQDNISWSTNSDGNLVITSPLTSPALSFNTNTIAARDSAVALGFLGTDLTVTQIGANLQISSTVTDRPSTETLTDTSGSVSRIGQSITIAGPVPEDLIIATNGEAGAVRQLTAQYQPDAKRVNPTMPDVNVTVTAPGKLTITDAATGSVLATRAYTTGMPISYMGSSFQIDGNAAVGDTFNISTDLNRPNDNRNGLALASLQTSNIFGPGSSTFQDIYENEIGKVGAAAQAASTNASATKTLSDDLNAAYSSATGVNMDTEATDLIKIQQAYQACAQIVSTARDMFRTLLTSLGG